MVKGYIPEVQMTLRNNHDNDSCNGLVCGAVVVVGWCGMLISLIAAATGWM